MRESGPRGRGVFALVAFAPGETIERAPVVAFPAEDWKHVDRTALAFYGYDWGDDGRAGAIVLGFGSIYNHSYEPNARYVRRLSALTMDYVARRAIAPGEEITVNYNGDPDDQSPLLFDVS